MAVILADLSFLQNLPAQSKLLPRREDCKITIGLRDFRPGDSSSITSINEGGVFLEPADPDSLGGRFSQVRVR